MRTRTTLGQANQTTVKGSRISETHAKRKISVERG